jgi:hypothetical protein
MLEFGVYTGGGWRCSRRYRGLLLNPFLPVYQKSVSKNSNIWGEAFHTERRASDTVSASVRP